MTVGQTLILENTTHRPYNDILFETIVAIDSSYLSIGWTYGEGNFDTDIILTKTNPSGVNEWQKIFGGFDQETGISINEFSNGNILLSGTSRSFGNGLGDCYFIITDNDGNKIHEFTLGSFGEDYLRESIIVNNEEIVFTGFSNSFGNGKKDVILGKIDGNGNLIWLKSFGGELDDEGWNVIKTEDNGYIVSGFTKKAESTTSSMIIRTDEDGNEMWIYERPQLNVQYGINSTIKEESGNFISGHTIFDEINMKSALEIFTISADGKLNTFKSYDYPLNMEFRSICKTSNGYVVAASSWEERSNSDIFILFLDNNFNPLTTFTINQGGMDDAWKVSSRFNKVVVSGSIENNDNLDGIFIVFDLASKSDSVKCMNLKVHMDAAIGYHDHLNTSSTNYGDAIQMAAYAIPGSFGGLNVNRALFSFDLDSLNNLGSIVSARLNLFASGPIGSVSGHEGSNQAFIQKIVEPWEEYQVTWDNQPNTTKLNEVILPKSTFPLQDYTNINILPLIKDIIENENYGFMLRLDDESPKNVLLLCSSDHPIIEKHPNLEICYTDIKTKTENYDKIQQVRYYPNPSNDYLFLEFDDADLQIDEPYFIFDIIGRMIQKGNLSFPLTKIQLTNFNCGIYFLFLPNHIHQDIIKFEVIKN
ncbi:MAG: DNRLRE domain-containing protein [Saprospiraceae bacterium]